MYILQWKFTLLAIKFGYIDKDGILVILMLFPPIK